MNHTTAAEAPQRRGTFGKIKDYVINVLGAGRDKVESFSADVEHRVFRIIWMVVWTLVGITCLSLALIFAMLTAIFGLDLPPIYAFGIPMVVFLVVGLVAMLMFWRAKNSKRKPR